MHHFPSLGVFAKFVWGYDFVSRPFKCVSAGIVAVMSVLCLIGIIVQLVKKHGRGRIRRNQRRVINSETSPLLTADI